MTRSHMHGWTVEQFEAEIRNLRGRLAYWLGRCPAGGATTDGFNETRCCWISRKINLLERELAGMSPIEPRKDKGKEKENSIEALSISFQAKVDALPKEEPVNPWRGLPAFITKREREEAMSGETEKQNDSAEELSPIAFQEGFPTVAPAELPTPTAAARRPYKPPKKKRRKFRLITDEVLSPSTPPTEASDSEDEAVIML